MPLFAAPSNENGEFALTAEAVRDQMQDENLTSGLPNHVGSNNTNGSTNQMVITIFFYLIIYELMIFTI